MAQIVPFGLTLLDPVAAVHPEPEDRAVHDQQRHLPTFTGRPLGERSREDLLVMSSPTETDGKDPIAVDTDPVYD